MIRCPRRAGRTALRGFGMIEVMVSLVVIAVALLGTAKIQAVTLNATHNSGVRSIAALQAASLAAAMRANEAYWTSAAVPTVVASGTAPGTTVLDSTLSSTAQSTNCSTVSASTGCSPIAQAAYDLQYWVNSLTATGGVIPNSWTNITCTPAGTGVAATCTVTINWLEKVIASNKLTTAGSPQALQYQLVVQP